RRSSDLKGTIMYDEYGEEFEPETRFDEMLDETYEAVHIGELTFDPSDILKSCDPVAYRVYLSDYESDMIESGEWSETDPTEDEEDEDCPTQPRRHTSRDRVPEPHD